MFNILEFQTAFSTPHCTVRQRILHGKIGNSVHTVCSYIAQNLHWITGVLANDIAAILPYKAHTCNQNVAIHSTFNILEFQTAFSTLHCTVRQRILYGKSAYSVHSVCSYIAQNVRWITGVLSNDIAAILPCTALYVQPKRTHTLHVQYTSVSSCFFTIILYCKQV